MQKTDEGQSIYGGITQLNSDEDYYDKLEVEQHMAGRIGHQTLKSLTVHHTWSPCR